MGLLLNMDKKKWRYYVIWVVVGVGIRACVWICVRCNVNAHLVSERAVSRCFGKRCKNLQASFAEAGAVMGLFRDRSTPEATGASGVSRKRIVLLQAWWSRARYCRCELSVGNSREPCLSRDVHIYYRAFHVTMVAWCTNTAPLI